MKTMIVTLLAILTLSSQAETFAERQSRGEIDREGIALLIVGCAGMVNFKNDCETLRDLGMCNPTTMLNTLEGTVRIIQYQPDREGDVSILNQTWHQINDDVILDADVGGNHPELDKRIYPLTIHEKCRKE